jgi:hypothetical protein
MKSHVHQKGIPMKLAALATAFLMIAGTAFAQEGGAPAARGGANAANTIKPGSMETPHGSNGFGGAYPVPGSLYRENPGNGFYGATTGDYGGQMQTAASGQAGPQR